MKRTTKKSNARKVNKGEVFNSPNRDYEKELVFYFQVHQPMRLRHYRIFDLGNHNYFDEKKNDEIMHKVAKKCYYPMNNLLLDLIHKYNIKVSFSITGVFLDQAERYEPKIIDSFEDLSKTKNVEFLNETYYHSLAWLKSKKEFFTQVKLHRKKIKELFKYSAKTFRNTELIYCNDLAKDVEKLEYYKNILAEGTEKILGFRSPNYRYKAKDCSLNLYLKNYRLSDDIAFRFSQKTWSEYPLTAEKYIHWIKNSPGEFVNLFMDYETFGEHQWADTGIFKFMEALPKIALKQNIGFSTISEIEKKHKVMDEIDVPYLISWADTERDLTAWLGNEIQRNAFDELYSIENLVLKTKNKEIIEDWRRLQTSDHFYYMCTKWFADGDVHKYFNPYESPYDAFINMMNILHDLVKRCEHVKRLDKKG
ncbi:MAG: glycoside hydrolase family 57 protein [Candidatus Woesearchaeota archaeon]